MEMSYHPQLPVALFSISSIETGVIFGKEVCRFPDPIGTC